jgi:hypothetical protein
MKQIEQLDRTVLDLYHHGRYAEAIPVAEKLLAIRERVFGPDHPDVALTLNDLANINHSLGKYFVSDVSGKRTGKPQEVASLYWMRHVQLLLVDEVIVEAADAAHESLFNYLKLRPPQR